MNKVFQKVGVCLLATKIMTPLVRAEGSSPSHSSSQWVSSELVPELQARIAPVSGSLESKVPGPAGGSSTGSRTVSRETAVVAFRIQNVLNARESMFAGGMIPSDPFSRLSREYRLAENDCQVLIAWWRYGGERRGWSPAALMDDLLTGAVLAINLESRKREIAELDLKWKTAEEPGIISLPPVITARLKQTAEGRKGVLDRISNWDGLSKEEKSKIIVR